MKHQMRILQGLKLAAVLAVALSMGACANKNLGADGAMASAATPGSQQDFVVNVGDRVFFESDQTDLSPQAIATLEKQARWLQTYNRYAFTIEGHADERGTREYNIALGARRAQSVRTFLASRGIDPSRILVLTFSRKAAGELRDRITAILGQAGLQAPVLPTGAGHDAGVLAARLPAAMLFVRNPTGVSHSPAEHAEPADCEAGVAALAAVLAELAGR